MAVSFRPFALNHLSRRHVCQEPRAQLCTRANHPRPQLAVPTRPVLFRCFPFRERDGESRHRRRREPRLVPGGERVVVRDLDIPALRRRVKHTVVLLGRLYAGFGAVGVNRNTPPQAFVVPTPKGSSAVPRGRAVPPARVRAPLRTQGAREVALCVWHAEKEVLRHRFYTPCTESTCSALARNSVPSGGALAMEPRFTDGNGKEDILHAVDRTQTGGVNEEAAREVSSGWSDPSARWRSRPGAGAARGRGGGWSISRRDLSAVVYWSVGDHTSPRGGEGSQGGLGSNLRAGPPCGPLWSSGDHTTSSIPPRPRGDTT